MRTTILISLGIAWLMFCGFWALLTCGFADEQPPAGQLRDCLTILLIFLVVGVGPIIVAGLVLKRKREK